MDKKTSNIERISISNNQITTTTVKLRIKSLKNLTLCS